MNAVFLAMIFIAFAVAATNQLLGFGVGDGGEPPMAALSSAMIEAAKGSVTLALGLIGVMALFLGLMKVAEAGGLLTVVARILRPVLRRLFPEVPQDHPAMGAVVMNISANALGLGNAATPFGIRAMQALDQLNPHKGTASNSMVLFLAINTSSVTLLPTGVIALRASAGSVDPAGIVATTLFATICSTTVAIIAAKGFQRLWPSAASVQAQADAIDTPGNKPDLADRETTATATASAAEIPEPAPGVTDAAPPTDVGETRLWVPAIAFAFILSFVPLTIIWGREIAPWIIPSLAILLLGFGWSRGVAVYETFVEGAKDGFQVAVRIIPYLVAILVAVAMFRASGAMDLIIAPLGAVTSLIGLPPEALPMALLRPLSGSGAYGVLASIIQDPAIGPDSYAGYLVSTFQGSTETTFYVLAVYFGAVQIRRIRHALAAALCADAAGIAAAVVICGILYG